MDIRITHENSISFFLFTLARCLQAYCCGYVIRLYVRARGMYARCLHHYLNNPRHRESTWAAYTGCSVAAFHGIISRHTPPVAREVITTSDRRRKPRFNPFSRTQNETPYCDSNDFNTIAFTRSPVSG